MKCWRVIILGICAAALGLLLPRDVAANAASPSNPGLSASVTDTVKRLRQSLDERGRSAVSADLEEALKGRKMELLPPRVRLDIASLQLSLSGVAAASAWARSGLRTLGVADDRQERPQLGAFSPDLQVHIAVAWVIIDRRAWVRAALQDCRRSIRHVAADAVRAGRPRCSPVAVAKTLGQMAWHDEAQQLIDDALNAEPAGLSRTALVLDAAQVADAAGSHDRQLALLLAEFGRTGGDVASSDDRSSQTALIDAITHAYRRLGKYEEALAWLDRLYQVAPKTRGILARYHHAFANFEGASTRRHGPYDRYIKAREALLVRALQPNDAPARYVAAMLALTDARYDEVVALLKSIAPLAIHDARPHGMQAMIAVWRGASGDAAGLLTIAEGRDPHDNIVPYVRSHIARQSGDLAAAVTHLERFLELRHDRKTTRFRRKKQLVLSDLHAMRRGELPPDLQRPDHPSKRYHLYSLFEPFELPPPPVFIGAILALLSAFGCGWWWSRRRT